jgi:sodium-dependent dicarboxylate transporter 2/3/5
MNLGYEAQALAVILATVVALWVTEALPLPVTALLGAVACVVAGVAPAKEVFRPFAEPIVFLFIGSFMLAEAIRVHGLDRRLAFGVLGFPWVGDRPWRVLAAVGFVSALISGFISNTATTAMMLAIAVGILAAIEHASRLEPERPGDAAAARLDPRFATGLLLCVPFTASVGGLATPIGTPPNMIGLGFIRSEIGVDVSFLAWCAVGVPVAAALAAVAVAVLAWMFPAGTTRLPGVSAFVAGERARLGSWSAGQRSTAVALAVTVALWVLPGVLSLTLGQKHPACGWLTARLPEGVAALVGAILLFLLPGGRRPDGSRRAALEWGEAAGIDWGIVLLYGGGMALGELSFSTGLASALGRSFTAWLPAGAGNTPALVAAASLVGLVISEFTSNTASANMVVPVAIALAQASGGDALVAALAATFASSLGFMMPVSTPCNAIAYGSGRIPLRSMMKSGAVLDVAGVIVITAAMLLLRSIWRAA